MEIQLVEVYQTLARKASTDIESKEMEVFGLFFTLLPTGPARGN